MSDMRFNVQTPIYVGENCMKKHADELQAFGKRAYVITSNFGEIRNYAREDVEEILKKLGVEYRVNDSVEGNTSAESVQAIAEEAKEISTGLSHRRGRRFLHGYDKGRQRTAAAHRRGSV